MQDSPALYASPLIHDKLITESLHSDGGEEYVNEHTAQDDQQSATKQLVKRNSFSSVLPSKHHASTSQYPEAPDARPTTTATDVPSTSVLRPLPVSSGEGTSYVDVFENRPTSIRFTDHNSPLLNRTPGNPMSYTTLEGMY